MTLIQTAFLGSPKVTREHSSDNRAPQQLISLLAAGPAHLPGGAELGSIRIPALAVPNPWNKLPSAAWMVQPQCLQSQFHLLCTFSCLFPHLSGSFRSKSMKNIPLTGKSLFSSHRHSGGCPGGSASSKSCSHPSQNSKPFLLTVNPHKSIPPPFQIPRLSHHQARL